MHHCRLRPPSAGELIWACPERARLAPARGMLYPGGGRRGRARGISKCPEIKFGISMTKKRATRDTAQKLRSGYHDVYCELISER